MAAIALIWEKETVQIDGLGFFLCSIQGPIGFIIIYTIVKS